jgi:plasmid stabilization system protein ParE
MAQGITWSTEAKASLRKLTKYLKDHYSQEYAERISDGYIREIEGVADHPTKGMFIDRKRNLRRWKLDRHNYLTYIITIDGIRVHDILPYKLNKKGF